MLLYEPGVQTDLLVLDWYWRMGQCDDLERVFSVTMAPCSAFMSEMRKCVLMYERDADGIYFAAWFDPAMAGAFHHAWIRADKRQSRQAFVAMLESIHLGLERWPVLLSVTRQAKLLSGLQRMGFTTLGRVPGLFDGDEAIISFIDADHFYEAVKKYERLFDKRPQTVLQTEAECHGR